MVQVRVLQGRGHKRRLLALSDAKFKLTDPIIANGVEKALEGETNLYWIGRKLFNYVIDKVEYELVGGWNIAPTVLDRGTGSCSEYSFVYIAMCRAAGLPARYAGSVAVRSDDASYDNVFHRWVEIYLPRYGWIPVDPSDVRKAMLISIILLELHSSLRCITIYIVC